MGVFVTLTVLAACGGSELPGESGPPEVAQDGTPIQTEPPATPTQAPVRTSNPASATPTEKPEFTPNLAPTEAAPADLSGNPDLDYAQVEFVRAARDGNGLWTFNTTVRHNDQGWDHYADAWQVLDLNGNLLAERILTHPHDNEQPFTRSQSNIDLPSDMAEVVVRAKCNVHGFGGQEVLVDLTAAEGENFEVSR